MRLQLALCRSGAPILTWLFEGRCGSGTKLVALEGKIGIEWRRRVHFLCMTNIESRTCNMLGGASFAVTAIEEAVQQE